MQQKKTHFDLINQAKGILDELRGELHFQRSLQQIDILQPEE